MFKIFVLLKFCACVCMFESNIGQILVHLLFLSSTTRIRTLFRWPSIYICRCSSFFISINKLINYYALLLCGWEMYVPPFILYSINVVFFFRCGFSTFEKSLPSKVQHPKRIWLWIIDCVRVMSFVNKRSWEWIFIFYFYPINCIIRYQQVIESVCHTWRKCTVRKTI